MPQGQPFIQKFHAWAVQFKVSVVLLLLLILGIVGLVLYYLYRDQARSQSLYRPKVTTLRVEEVPFPKGGIRPVEVMSGVSSEITCEVVTPPEKVLPVYRFVVGGQIFNEKDCRHRSVFSGTPGSVQGLSLDYMIKKPSGETDVVDHWVALVTPIQANEYLKIYSLENDAGQAIKTLTAPMEVVPYVKAAIKLEGDSKHYSALFFVNEVGSQQPVLQVIVRPHSTQAFEVNKAPLERYRRYGPEIAGYTAWPADPIQIGTPEEDRKVFEIFVGIFKTDSIKYVTERCLTFKGISDGKRAQFEVNKISIPELKQLAWHEWLSDPIRVVRSENAPTRTQGAIITEIAK